MAKAQINFGELGGGVKTTDFMAYKFVPYDGSSYKSGMILCVKGYSKIGITCDDSDSRRRIDIYTATDLSDITGPTSSDTLLGYAVGTSETQIDVSSQDYIWFYTHDTSSASKHGQYRLVV